MTSVLSTSSRSYCISLHNSPHELALTLCNEAEQRVRREMNAVLDINLNTDFENTQIADAIFEKGGYAAKHPLTVNSW